MGNCESGEQQKNREIDKKLFDVSLFCLIGLILVGKFVTLSQNFKSMTGYNCKVMVREGIEHLLAPAPRSGLLKS